MREISYDTPARIRYVDGQAMPLRAHLAEGFLDRFLGLMGQPEVPSDGAMVFPRCTSIHMFHMKTPIDAVWVTRPNGDGVMRILRVDRQLMPRAISLGPVGAWGVAELAPGAVREGDDPVTLVVETLSRS